MKLKLLHQDTSDNFYIIKGTLVPQGEHVTNTTIIRFSRDRYHPADRNFYLMSYGCNPEFNYRNTYLKKL